MEQCTFCLFSRPFVRVGDLPSFLQTICQGWGPSLFLPDCLWTGRWGGGGTFLFLLALEDLRTQMVTGNEAYKVNSFNPAVKLPHSQAPPNLFSCIICRTLRNQNAGRSLGYSWAQNNRSIFYTSRAFPQTLWPDPTQEERIWWHLADS